ncbi:MAG: rod shape-determining protein MreD [Clostridia bacterium]|jgi:rod shape-determining protein MreD|nr:rod shape-determining protein MreD [Clostridia bacterium]MBT7123352.1 rod shape-determining protein MreD [Clostridia bacterium]
MRYVFFVVVSIVSLIFTGAVFPNLNIAGIYPDLIIVSIVSIAILERSMAGAMIGLVCGLILDVLFSDAIGVIAIPYLIIGAAMFFVRKNLRYMDRFVLPAVFAFSAHLVKEFISALIAYMLGRDFSFWFMFARYILPKAVFSAVIMLLVHMLFTRIYRASSMKLKDSRDFRHL